jgi:hypothetical protein
MPSVVDAVISNSLQLSVVNAPFGIGVDVLWPLTGMALYVVMVKVLEAKFRKNGVPASLVKFYNIFIMAVSAGILAPTLYFRFAGFTSLQKAYCPSGGAAVSEGLRLCLWAYHVSKYSEYADTAFLILKDKDVGSLHFWHHLIVTFTSWTWLRCEIEWVADGVIFNTFVHCIMYYYYYLGCCGRSPWWKKYVTSLQIVQFVSSFVATGIWSYFHLTVGCGFVKVIAISVAFNAWLLCMFVAFYSTTYKKKS